MRVRFVHVSILLMLAAPARADLLYELCVTDEGEDRAAYCQCNEDHLKQEFTQEEYTFFIDMTEIMIEGRSDIEASILVSGYDWDVLQYEDFREKATIVMDAAEEICK